MRILLINNLASGFGEGAIYDYMRALVGDGDEVVIRSTDGTSDLRLFLYDAEYYDLVVAAGGDGTVAAVAHMLAQTGIPILPFPAGTANLVAMNLGLPSEPHALAKLTRAGRYLDFDMGQIELSDGTTRGFTLMAGAGYDAAIMAGAASSKKLLGPMAYFTSAVANANSAYAHFTLTIDGTTIESDGVGILIINFSHMQFDLAVVHENAPRDGMLDIVILNTKDAYGLIPALVSCVLDINGDFPERPDELQVFRGKSVHVESNPPLQVQFDGELTDTFTPFKVELIPHAARFIASEQSEHLFNNKVC